MGFPIIPLCLISVKLLKQTKNWSVRSNGLSYKLHRPAIMQTGVFNGKIERVCLDLSGFLWYNVSRWAGYEYVGMLDCSTKECEMIF